MVGLSQRCGPAMSGGCVCVEGYGLWGMTQMGRQTHRGTSGAGSLEEGRAGGPEGILLVCSFVNPRMHLVRPVCS